MLEIQVQYMILQKCCFFSFSSGIGIFRKLTIIQMMIVKEQNIYIHICFVMEEDGLIFLSVGSMFKGD